MSLCGIVKGGEGFVPLTAFYVIMSFSEGVECAHTAVDVVFPTHCLVEVGVLCLYRRAESEEVVVRTIEHVVVLIVGIPSVAFAQFPHEV